MNVLGRKLYAAFERKSGKIEKINPKIAPDISEDYLSLFYFPASVDENTNATWVIYPGKHKDQQPANKEPIKRSRSAIEVLAWCFFNKILDKSTHIVLNTRGSDLDTAELKKIILCFVQLYPKRHVTADQSAFSSTAVDEKITLFINVGVDPMKSMSQKGVHRISANNDALRYSGLQTNLALSVDQVSTTSWKEVVASRFDGDSAIVDCIGAMLRNTPPGKGRITPKVEIFCFCANRAGAIAQRVRELFTSIIECFYSHPDGKNNRYIVEIGNTFYIIQFDLKQARIKHVKNYGNLVHQLASPQNHYSRIILDNRALEGSTLSVVSQNDIRNVIQVFFMPRNKTAINSLADVYVLDEKGSLFSYTTTFNDEKTFIPPMLHFIQSALNRQKNATLMDDMGERQCDQVMFYEIIPAKKDHPIHAENKGVLRQVNTESFYSMQAIIEQTENGEMLYTIYCDDKEFSQLEHGHNLFNIAAAYIISMRPSRSRYPIYITDLDLSRSHKEDEEPKNIQISQYMAQKQVIETRLNEALSRL
ncbi:MAG: class I adenylate cyclase [Pseudomonadales bacterium]|nr:class I adenylate cyclase [Pseudomonadales bacterium]